MSNFCEVILKCGNWQEAKRIADALLTKHLVACVDFVEVKSKYHWRGKIEEADEIKLIMETVAENFDPIEAEVTKLHSYDTFVLQQITIDRVSEAAQAWWKTESQAKD